MKSNIRVFRDSGTEARGRILPLEQFCLCSDLPEHRIQDEIGTYFVQCAEEMLEETIPLLPLSLYRDLPEPASAPVLKSPTTAAV